MFEFKQHINFHFLINKKTKIHKNFPTIKYFFKLPINKFNT